MAKKAARKKVTKRSTPRGMAALKKKIIKKIDRDLKHRARTAKGLNSYYKDPGNPGGGIYGKGTNPVFGKSETPRKARSRKTKARSRA